MKIKDKKRKAAMKEAEKQISIAIPSQSDKAKSFKRKDLAKYILKNILVGI